jgi:hypothetical protein
MEEEEELNKERHLLIQIIVKHIKAFFKDKAKHLWMNTRTIILVVTHKTDLKW